MNKNIINQPIIETLETNYMPYAMSVIVSRAIPEIDGFKPSHRKLLYTMFKMGLLKGNKVKSADVVGQTMRLNPHGDMSIYETLVRLTRGNNALIHPFIDSKGNFGKQNSRDMAFAASRYTEVKLDSICEEIFKNIDKDTVKFIDNYNGTTKEPMLLPTTYPNILITPNQGIAVGMASSICSFNLREVCKTTINYIKNPEVNIIKTLKAPDFSTGGTLIYNEEQIKKIYETGRGSIKVRAKYRYDKKNNCIEITEIPYTTTIEAIIDKIIVLIKSNKIREINDVRDETDINGMKLTLDLKKGVDEDKLMSKLYKYTTLSDNYNCNFNILVEGKPCTIGIREIIKAWLNFRITCIKGQTNYSINIKSEKLELLDGLNKILIDIDEAIKIIRKTRNEKDVIANLVSNFNITTTQAEYIAEIKLRNLNNEYLLNRINERDILGKEISELKELLKSEEKIKILIIDELTKISKKYGKTRRTNIIKESEIAIFNEETLIQDYKTKVFLTKEGYLKKISKVSLRSASKQNLKENDKIICEKESTNREEILLFSNKQNLYKIKGFEMASSKASDLGEYVYNILPVNSDEKIIYMTSTLDFKGDMIYIFENGTVARVPLNLYQTKVNRKKLVNVYNKKEKIAFILHIESECKISCVDSLGKVSKLMTKLVPIKNNKTAIGTKLLKIKKGSVIEKLLDVETK